MKDQARLVYEFDQFRLDASRRLLYQNGRQVRLTPKAVELLLVFVANPGRLLTKEDLLDRLWPDTSVGENNLSQNISLLRKVLGERLGAHKYIVTSSGRGYRFVAEVREVNEGGPSGDAEVGPPAAHPSDGPRPQAPPVAKPPARAWGRRGLPAAALLALCLVALAAGFVVYGPRRRPGRDAVLTGSVAVLPFRVLNSKDCKNPFGVKMADAVITALGDGRGVNVRPTGDVIRYVCREESLVSVGRDLGVDFLLEGKVQNTDGQIKLTAQLVRVNDGASLWTGKFLEDYTDCLAVQDKLSGRVVEELMPRRAGSGSPVATQAAIP